MKNIDRWDVLSLVAMGLCGAGVWARFGWPWAFMLWGALLLAVVVVHAAVSRPGGN